MENIVDFADRKYLSVSEATEIVGCSTRTMLRWIHAGQFEALRLPGAIGYRIDQSSFEKFLRSRAVVRSAKREISGE